MILIVVGIANAISTQFAFYIGQEEGLVIGAVITLIGLLLRAPQKKEDK